MRDVLRLIPVCLTLACAAAPTLAGPTWMRYAAISPDGASIAFSYRGDLWRVPAAGGTAVALTRHAAHDTRPVWSRDGSRIAFSSDRYGNADVFVMAATGGVATRLTFHSSNDTPYSFTPDGSEVLFGSARLDRITQVQYPTGAQPELYAVRLDGGMPRQVLSSPAIDAVHDRAGTRLLYHDLKGYENRWRKHDDSSFARDVWLLDVTSGEHRKLTDFGHDDREPVWSADERSIYYLSEKSGSFNVWRLDPDGPGSPRQITHHERHPVRFLSVSDDGTLAYVFDGAIHTRGPDARESRKVAVVAPADLLRNDIEHIDVAQQITEFAISPDGKEMAFVARGEIFVTSTDHSATRRITGTPEQERSVSFSPEGRSLLYASERNGSWNLYRADLGDDDEPSFFNATSIVEKPVLEIEAETFQPRFSPDGKEVAYLQERTELRVLDLGSGKTRRIMAPEMNYSYVDGDLWYEWSPDGSQFLVEFLSPTRWSSEIGLVPASGGGEIVNLTRAGYEDVMPRWALGGKAMYWFTDRFGRRLQAGWPSEFDIRLAFFTQEAWDRFRLSEAELEQLVAREEEAKKATKEEDDKKNDKDKKKEGKKDEPKLPDPVEVEVEGLENRTVRLTIHSSSMADAALTPDGETLLYLARFEKGFDLWSYAHRKQEIKLLAKLNAERAGDLHMDKEGKKAFLLADGSLKTVAVESGEVKPVALSAPMELDARAERAYMFEHAWRQTLKKFHDVEMHGVDWDYYKKSYARFLDDVENNHDFAELLSEMLGELNASHTGSGYRPRNPEGDQTASLGIFPDTDWSGDGIRIAEILEGGPLQQSGSKIEVGTVIEAIDGERIPAGTNWYPLLNRKAGRWIRLTLKGRGKGEGWEEKVKPVDRDGERELLYDRWVRGRRADVDRLSGGRIGYAHIRGMNDRSFRVIYDDIFGEAVTKEAIVLDTRFNGGGNLDEALTTFLSGEIFMTATPRGRKIGTEPSSRWTKPSIVVQNEGNYSDAHCFPNAYRTLGLGKTVGMPVPGTCTAVWWEVLQDRSLFFGIPQVTLVDVAGDPLENKHFAPDFEIDNEPRLEAEGRDQQVEKAVEVLLRELPPA